ncbi:MAG TPA: ADOP family duplicated permease [Gemmatimonadaceae bacterium]|jgi:predicted permease|nr:ADOP family duplicated permease [Gemmatimonadaceae bacterium]
MNELLESFGRDLRYAARGLRRSPGFALAVMLTLGLGIGANTAMLDAVDRLMFRPFPYLRDPATVHRVYFQSTRGRETHTWSLGPYATYLDLRRSATEFGQYAGFTEWPLALGDGQAATEHVVAGVSASFFGFFDARPHRGRFFGASEDAPPRGAGVAVLSYGYWQSEFAGQNVIGRALRVGPLITTIIGVAPQDFIGVSEGEPPAVFLPLTTIAYGVNQGDAKSFATKYNWDWMYVMARRKPGVSVDEATADLTNAFVRSREKAREQLPMIAPATVAHPRAIAGALRKLAGPDAGLQSKTLLWVTGVAVVVLLIACANIANLLLARFLERRREIAVRLAIGASSRRLLSQFLAESLWLAALGAVAGLGVAGAVSAELRRLLPAMNASAGAMSSRGLLTAVALALVVVMLTGVGPALLSIRGTSAMSLRTGARGGTYQHARLRAMLLVVQGALSVALLVAAGLFVRSLENARSVRLGWNPERVLVVAPNYRGVRMDSASSDEFRRRLLDVARAVPGVEAAARVDNLPFLTSTWDFHVDGIDSVARLGRFVHEAVSSDYLNVVGTRILRGRGLNARDRGDAPSVAVVSEAMGRALWPGRDPIGQCFRLQDDPRCTTVVGVAEDAAQTGIADDDRFAYYMSDEQAPHRPANRIFLRMAAGDPRRFAERVRREVQRVMPGAAYVTVSPLEDLVDAQRRSWMLGAAMFAAFGGLALLVAAVGLYSVISYHVAQRGHELGVRIALGARGGNIVRLVVGQGASTAAAGIGIGLLAASAAARWVQPLLFRESALDPAVYAVVAVTVLLAALAASAVPARRALRTDPNIALKNE